MPSNETGYGPAWIIPFCGLLLSIGILPLVAARLWHHHYGKVALLWALALAVPLALLRGTTTASHQLLHALLTEYLPFIILLLALYTVTGGIRVTGTLRGTPTVNTLMLAIGTALASVTGTTGAAMLLVRPMIRANRERRHTAHIFVFFIFLVANIGGSLTPLGDPPLFIAFMQGVPFFWPTRNLLAPMLLCTGILLAIFYAMDRYYHRRGPSPEPDPLKEVEKLGIEGRINIVLLAGIVLTVLLSGLWESEAHVILGGVRFAVDRLAADAALLVIVLLSLLLTTPECRVRNEFSWDAMGEVAILFAAIFVTIVPALQIMQEGAAGPAAPLVDLLGSAEAPDDTAYFWATGLLSAFLDNAPTWLVFFNLAGGDVDMLTGPLASTLAAISAGAVFFGAGSYIGNAPNLMVKAVAEGNGIRMPGFFGYIGWSAVFLLPLFALVSAVFF